MMSWLRFFGIRRMDQELNEEIQAHLRMAIQDRVERGESAEQARLAALREFGNRTLVKETTRSVWAWTAFEQALQDLRVAARGLAKSPLFASAAVILIALGIGANSAVFTLVGSLLLKPMPGVQAEGLVSLGVLIDGRPDDPGNSYLNYLDYAAQTKTLRSVVARGFERFTLGLEKTSYAFRGGLVTPNYFDTLGVRLIKGRTFTEPEGRLDASGLVAIVSYQVWQEQFSAAEDIIGAPVTLNGHAATIVGVAPPHFCGIQTGESQDIWVPLASYCRIHGRNGTLHDRSERSIEMVGQLGAGATLSEARAEFALISRRLQAAYPEANKRMAVQVVPYSALGPGIQMVRAFLKVLVAVAMLTLLVICANVANLVLSRSTLRRQEMAIRQALGASRGRLFRLLLAEGVILASAATVAAWFVGSWATAALVRLVQTGRQTRLELDLAPDWRVALYALALAVLSMLAFTAAPALRTWQQHPLESLKAGQPTAAPARRRLSSIFVVVQITLGVILLTGAAMLQRSQYLLNTFEPGFDRNGLLLVTVDTSASAGTPEQERMLLERLVERLRAVPGVAAVSYALIAPLSWARMVLGPVRGDPSRDPVRTDGDFVGPDYLHTLGVPVNAGRDITAQDRAGGRRIAVINQNLAQALWPGENALGRTILLPDSRNPVEVVGIAPNAAYSDVGMGDLGQAKRRNFLFLAYQQNPRKPGQIVFYVRYSGSLQTLAPSIRAAVRDTDFRLPIFRMGTAVKQLEDSTPLQPVTTLVTLFAAGALFLAGVGLYAVVAFRMAQRTREFAIRMALGAAGREIVNMVLKQAALLAAIGLSAGSAISMPIGRVFRVTLFGVTATDGLTYATVFTVLAAVCLAACFIPARRATRIDPAQALRQE